MKSLTKENFWNELHEQYPVQMKVFCDWIDQYKKKDECAAIFYPPVAHADFGSQHSIKYHDLPFAMQVGIFLEFTLVHPGTHGFDLSMIKKMEDYLKIPNLIKLWFEKRAGEDDYWNLSPSYVSLTQWGLDPEKFDNCPTCDQKPRVWIFDNGCFAKCRCNGKYDAAPAQGISVNEYRNIHNGDMSKFNYDSLIDSWNNCVRIKKQLLAK